MRGGAPAGAADAIHAIFDVGRSSVYLLREHQTPVLASLLDAAEPIEPGMLAAALSLIEVGHADALEARVAVLPGIADALGRLLHEAGERDAIAAPEALGAGTRLTRDGVYESRPLQTLQRHSRHASITHVRHTILNALAWLIRLSPQHVGALLIDDCHPLLLAAASHVMTSPDPRPDYLAWIDEGAGECTVGAVIFHTLDRAAGGAARVAALSERLCGLLPVRAARWFGEALSECEYIVPRTEPEVHERCLEALEAGAAKTLQAAPDVESAVEAFVDGLLTPPRKTSVHHLQRVADLLAPGQTRLAGLLQESLLRCYWTTLERADSHGLHVGGEADAVRWTNAVGLVLGRLADTEDGAVIDEARAQLDGFALSIWDHEEDYRAFMRTASVAAHVYTVVAIAASAASTPEARACLGELCRRIWRMPTFLAHLNGGAVDAHAEWTLPTVARSLLQLESDPSVLAFEVFGLGAALPTSVLAVLAEEAPASAAAEARRRLIERSEGALF